jgi:hypothetical protein
MLRCGHVDDGNRKRGVCDKAICLVLAKVTRLCQRILWCDAEIIGVCVARERRSEADEFIAAQSKCLGTGIDSEGIRAGMPPRTG